MAAHGFPHKVWAQIIKDIVITPTSPPSLEQPTWFTFRRIQTTLHSLLLANKTLSQLVLPHLYAFQLINSVESASLFLRTICHRLRRRKFFRQRLLDSFLKSVVFEGMTGVVAEVIVSKVMCALGLRVDKLAMKDCTMSISMFGYLECGYWTGSLFPSLHCLLTRVLRVQTLYFCSCGGLRLTLPPTTT